jgi:hypothetical protein
MGLAMLMPCVCCGGCLAYASTFKDVTISNGEHLGGSPMNVRFNYEIRNSDRGPPKSYYVVVEAANGTKRENTLGGFRFPVRGTSQFPSNVDLGPENNKKPVTIWIETEDVHGSRSTASNTLTIYPKS